MTDWLTPGLSERLIELHMLDGEQELSAREIAQKLNSEFGTHITRNAIIGRCRRLQLQPREAPIVRNYVSRKKPSIKKPVEVVVAIDDVFAVPIKRKPRKPRPLTIYRLKRCHCRWPNGEIDAPPPYIYCGQQTVGSSSYCEEHYNRAHVTPRKVWS